MMDFFTDLHPLEALGNTFGLPRVNNFLFGSTERINVFTTGPSFTAESLIDFYKPNGLNDILNNEEKTLIEGHEYFLEVSKETDNEVEKVEFPVKKQEDSIKIVLPENLEVIRENIKDIEANINKSEAIITDLQGKASSIKKTQEVLVNLNIKHQNFNVTTNEIFYNLKNNFQTTYKAYLDKPEVPINKEILEMVRFVEVYIECAKDLVSTSTNINEVLGALRTVKPIPVEKSLEGMFLSYFQDIKRLCSEAQALNPELYSSILRKENIPDVLEQPAVYNESEMIVNAQTVLSNFSKDCSAEIKTILVELHKNMPGKKEEITNNIFIITTLYMNSFDATFAGEHYLLMCKFYSEVDSTVKEYNEINTENEIKVEDVLVEDNLKELNTSLDTKLKNYKEQESYEKKDLNEQQNNLMVEKKKIIKEIFKSSEDNIKDSNISVKLDENKKHDGFFTRLFDKLSTFKFW